MRAFKNKFKITIIISKLAIKIDDSIYIHDFEFTNFMGGICIALVLSDGSAVYLVGESIDAEDVINISE